MTAQVIHNFLSALAGITGLTAAGFSIAAYTVALDTAKQLRQLTELQDKKR